MQSETPSAPQAPYRQPHILESDFVPALKSVCSWLRPLVNETLTPDVFDQLDYRLVEFSHRWRGVSELSEHALDYLQHVWISSREHRAADLATSDVGQLLQRYYWPIENISSQIASNFEALDLGSGAMPTRTLLINALIQQTGAARYLEIGCCNNACFDQITCSQKVGVDPASGGTLRITSDEFFRVNVQSFDVIFIDGLHEAWQVDKDIENALACSTPNAIIVLHDCNPLFEVRAHVPRIAETWNGDVWKSLVRVRSRMDLDCATGAFDHGCAIIRKRANSKPIDVVEESSLTYQNLEKHRTEWLRLMSYNELLQWCVS
jgi:predicted O-methyltransferase YrrM